ncbi:hypothetical protein ACFL23_01750 [Patescibacteria group bacterium]
MSEQINEYKIEDTKSPEEKKSGDGFEIEKSPELENVVAGISEIKDAVDHDEPVKLEQVKKVEEAVENEVNIVLI